jgi:glycosyltransferase involved in cell wall biosynthesis
MKIAYLSTFYPYRGGIAQYNAALYNALSALGHDVKPYTFFRQYPELLFPGKSQFVQPDDNAEKIDAERILDTVNPISYVRAANKIKRFEPDIYLTKFWMPFFAPSLGKVAKALRNSDLECYNISILDNVIPHEKRLGDMNFIKYFLNNNDGFIVMSEKVKHDLTSLKPDAIYEHQVHPLYDHFGEKKDQKEARQKLGIGEHKRVLLFFGFIRKYKGLDLLIRTLYDLPEDYHLIIAGETYEDFSANQKMIKDLRLEDRITLMVRYINDSEVPDLFSAADVCVLPYRSATQSGIVGISYHFDLPLIATKVGGLEEMIGNYQTGIMAERADRESLKAAIFKFFNDGRRDELKKNIAKYKNLATWNSLAAKIESLYDKLREARIKKQYP